MLCSRIRQYTPSSTGVSTDIYDQSTYFKANGFYGPGGSSGTITHNVGVNPIDVNGMQTTVNGSFAAPTTQGNVILNGTALTFSSSSGEWTDANSNWTITDFTLFGADGTAANSIINYVASGGSHDINLLQQDYDLRWTGVLGDTTVGGKTIKITKSGGSFATLIGAHQYKLGAHPLNPSPGTNKPFTIRIPFEVWCIDKNEQVNLLVYDRTGDPTLSTEFEVWNMINRTYVWAVSTEIYYLYY